MKTLLYLGNSLSCHFFDDTAADWAAKVDAIDFFTIRPEDVTIGNGSSKGVGGTDILEAVTGPGFSTSVVSGTCLLGFNFSEDAFGFGLGAGFAFVT